MENNENNNLNELDQLKAQYETLKQQFDQQEIVNDRLMKSSIKRSMHFYKRYRNMQFIVYPIMAIVGLLMIKWFFGNLLSLKGFWIAFCVICFVVEMWMTRIVRFKTMENTDLLTLSNHARTFKKLYAIFVVSYVISLIIIVVGGIISETGIGYSFKSAILAFCFVIVFSVSVALAEVRYKTRPCDEIIRQIEAFETTNKETGLNKKQKWFCVAMIVAFIGLDIWAYTIVGTYLKLPPMWRQVTYTRTDDSLTVDDGLSIWQVLADTLVSADEVPALMVPGNGVMMKDKDNDGQQVRLYWLKKNSDEGPIISSSCIGGKPVVEKMVVQKPRIIKDSENIPMTIYLTPEAKRLWSECVKIISKNGIMTIDIALVVDGVVYQKMNFSSIQNATPNAFYIWRKWSSQEELETFCERLVRQ